MPSPRPWNMIRYRRRARNVTRSSPRSRARQPRPPPCTLHPAPYTLHPTPHTLHPSPYTLHPSPYTLHPTPHTLHPTPYTLNRASGERCSSPRLRARQPRPLPRPFTVHHLPRPSTVHHLHKRTPYHLPSTICHLPSAEGERRDAQQPTKQSPAAAATTSHSIASRIVIIEIPTLPHSHSQFTRFGHVSGGLAATFAGGWPDQLRGNAFSTSSARACAALRSRARQPRPPPATPSLRESSSSKYRPCPTRALTGYLARKKHPPP